jgi:biotin transporter BioY
MLARVQHRTFIETFVPQRDRTVDILLVIAGSLVVAALARITIPIGPVPISGQTLGVLLVAATLGARRGFWAMIAYIAQGTAGLPVFAGGRGGPAVLAGPTGGYLVGFALAALVVGSLCERGMDRRPATTLVAMAAGTLVIYASGVLWLARFTGWSAVMQLGVYPFVFGDVVKALLAALAMPLAWRLRRRNQQDDHRL